MPTAAGPAKRPWICSIAVKSAENPWRARAGAMIRISSAQIAARSGSRWKSAAGASGQIAQKDDTSTSRTPTQPASAEMSRQALSSPASSRSLWNTGITRVTRA